MSKSLKWMDIQSASKELRCSPKELKKRFEAGRLPRRKVGRKFEYQVMAWDELVPTPEEIEWMHDLLDLLKRKPSMRVPTIRDEGWLMEMCDKYPRAIEDSPCGQ